MARFKTPKARRKARERAYGHPRKRSAASPGTRYMSPKKHALLQRALARADRIAAHDEQQQRLADAAERGPVANVGTVGHVDYSKPGRERPLALLGAGLGITAAGLGLRTLMKRGRG